MLVLASCAADRYRWNMEHAHLSPNARKLPPAEIEQIVRMITAVEPDMILGIGQTLKHVRPDEMNVATGYTEDRCTIFELRRVAGQWRIVHKRNVMSVVVSVWIDQ
jgi:hypothetical protein